MPPVEFKVFPIEALREFCARVFLHFGVPKDDATQATDVLASADLRGIDSHGVARMYSYVGMLSEGHINPKPKISIVRSTMSTVTIDGDNGLGLVVGPHSNRIAMDMAEKAGSGWVSVCNTNHFGIAGYYVLQALERDLKRLLVEGFGALNVLNIELEPTYNIAVSIHSVSFVWCFKIN